MNLANTGRQALSIAGEISIQPKPLAFRIRILSYLVRERIELRLSFRALKCAC